MSFEDYIRYIKRMSIEEFNNMSLEAKMQVEIEYDVSYGI